MLSGIRRRVARPSVAMTSAAAEPRRHTNRPIDVGIPRELGGGAGAATGGRPASRPLSRRRVAVAVLACMCVSVSWSTVRAGEASGAVTHEYLSQITEVPAGPGVASPGPLFGVNAMAIDSGNLYVAEEQSYPAPERLDEFDAASGAFLRQFALPTSLHAFYGYGVAAGHSTGEEQVYAGAFDEEYKNVVAVFDGEGHMLGSPWTGSDTPQGSFSFFGIGGIAADSSTSLSDWAAGDVYVSDVNNKVVDVFKPLPGGKEEYVAQMEGPETGVPFAAPSLVAVDQTNGDVAVVDEGKLVDIFEPTMLGKYTLVRKLTGTPAGPFHEINYFGKGLAVDSNGDTYVPESNPSVVDEFSANGEYMGRLTGRPARPFHRAEGAAIDPKTNKLYVGDASNYETEEPGVIDVFGSNLVIPDVTTSSASNTTPTSATVGGTVNPDNAGEATCQVVWGTSPEFGNTTPCQSPIANGETAVAVQVLLTELTPDTTYWYRVQAADHNGLNPGEAYQDGEFHTSGPGIHQTWASDVGSSSVTLSAKIDPNGSPTEYYFQYGTNTGYGSDIPLSPDGLGSGQGDVEISQHIQGLSAATSYHYRVVAISEMAPGQYQTFDGPDGTFLTQPGISRFELPDGRAWEMVSPPNKHGAGLEPPMVEYGKITQASVSGGAIAYTAYAPTEEQPEGNRAAEPTQLLSRRSVNGWETKAITTPFARVGNFSAFGEYRLFSPNLSEAVVYPYAETALSSEATERTPYLRHNDTCEVSPTTCYTPLVTAANVEPGLQFGEEEIMPVAASPDLSHIILKSENGYTDHGKLLPGGKPDSAEYEWHEGRLQPVEILPNEELAEYGYVGRNGDPNVRHAVSGDGVHIVFESGQGLLYTRNMATGKTVQIDVAEPGATGGQSHPVFQLASNDGSKIVFTDTARLTADSTASDLTSKPDLYEFNLATGKLTDLTVDHNPGEHADVQGLVQGASEDGAYVYFVAKGALASGATPGGFNLYLLHAGVTTYIATLSGGDQYWEVERGNSRLEKVTARVSPNGQWFAFMSERSLTGYDNRDANSGKPDEEVFLYDANTNHLSCASCNPSGARPVGIFEPEGRQLGPLVDTTKIWQGHWLAGLIPSWENFNEKESVYQSQYLTNSGRLFFMSNEALAPQDVNGMMDVYEYEPTGEGGCTQATGMFQAGTVGCVGLISSGGSSEESMFMDANENGDEAFFLTASKLSPEDYDNALDLYDARVCSSASPCLAVSPASPPPCTSGDSCKPAPSPQPTIFGAAPSATFSGIGNVVPEQHSAVVVRPLTRAQKLARALRVCAHKHNRRKRAACVKQAHRRYAARSAKKRSLSITSGR